MLVLFPTQIILKCQSVSYACVGTQVYTYFLLYNYLALRSQSSETPDMSQTSSSPSFPIPGAWLHSRHISVELQKSFKLLFTPPYISKITSRMSSNVFPIALRDIGFCQEPPPPIAHALFLQFCKVRHPTNSLVMSLACSKKKRKQACVCTAFCSVSRVGSLDWQSEHSSVTRLVTTCFLNTPWVSHLCVYFCASSVWAAFMPNYSY